MRKRNILFTDPPTVSPLNTKRIIEGNNLSVACHAEPGNPNTTNFFWTKSTDSKFRVNESILRIAEIKRASSGNYTCTAENVLANGPGTHSQSMIVNVLCK